MVPSRLAWKAEAVSTRPSRPVRAPGGTPVTSRMSAALDDLPHAPGVRARGQALHGPFEDAAEAMAEDDLFVAAPGCT